VNSFLSLFANLPHLYPPQNLLRLITGTLMGITIGSLVFVMFNSLVWRAPNPRSIFATPREFFALLGLGTLLVLVVHSDFAPLVYPLNLAIVIAILLLHVTLMTALVANLTHPALNWRQAMPAFALGALIALSYLSAIALLRVLLLPTL
jgi:hypothetical protein